MSRSARGAELRGQRRRTVVPPAADVVEAARAAGLRYVNATLMGTAPGWKPTPPGAGNGVEQLPAHGAILPGRDKSGSVRR